jgi:hypothetical protein
MDCSISNEKILFFARHLNEHFEAFDPFLMESPTGIGQILIQSNHELQLL